MRLKKTISSTGLMPPSLTGNRTASRDGSRKPCTSVRKASVQSTEMRGASPWATATTVFLTRSLHNVSRTGSSEYQLHLMKISDRDRNVNKKLVLVVFLVKFIIKCFNSNQWNCLRGARLLVLNPHSSCAPEGAITTVNGSNDVS